MTRYRLMSTGWTESRPAHLLEGPYAEVMAYASLYGAREFLCLDTLGPDDQPGACPACAGAADPWAFVMTEGCRAGRSEMPHLDGPEDYTYLRLERIDTKRSK